ncbi:MAG: hypothetical protein WC708_10610, partial [Lentisphaeria bacterium]
KLDVAELRQALAFELGRRSPLPPDRLAWGWRQLPGATAAEGVAGQRVRLGFLREADWRHILDDLAGMGAGVDACLPPALALDPVLAGQPVFFPADPSQPAGAGFVLRPDGAGHRTMEQVAAAPDGLFGSPTGSLALAGVELAPELAALEPAAQARYAGALILALYGLGRQLAVDRRSWLPLPRELRIHRHRAGRIAAVCLAAYLALVTVVAVGRRVADNARHLAQLKSELAEVQKKIEGFKAKSQEREFLAKLEGEFRDARLDRPGLVACLAELTRVIPKEAWSQNVSWTEGRLETELVTASDTFNPLPLIEASAVLGNVEPVRKSVDANKQVSWRVRAEAMDKPAGSVPAAAPAVAAPAAPATPPAVPAASPPPPPPPPPPGGGAPADDGEGQP